MDNYYQDTAFTGRSTFVNLRTKGSDYENLKPCSKTCGIIVINLISLLELKIDERNFRIDSEGHAKPKPILSIFSLAVDEPSSGIWQTIPTTFPWLLITGPPLLPPLTLALTRK